MATSGVAIENWDKFLYFAPILFQVFSKAEKKKKNPESSVVSGGFPRWLSGKESAYNTGDVDSIPGSGTLEKEMATCSSILAWEILMDRGAWQATVPSHKESDTTKQLNSLKTRNN